MVGSVELPADHGEVHDLAYEMMSVHTSTGGLQLADELEAVAPGPT